MMHNNMSVSGILLRSGYTFQGAKRSRVIIPFMNNIGVYSEGLTAGAADSEKGRRRRGVWEAKNLGRKPPGMGHNPLDTPGPPLDTPPPPADFHSLLVGFFHNTITTPRFTPRTQISSHNHCHQKHHKSPNILISSARSNV